MKLKDYCNFTTKGLNFSKNEARINLITDFYEAALYNADNAWYYLTMSCINDNFIEKVCMFKENRDYSKYVLRDGDIVLCKLGPYFRSAIYDNVFPFADTKEFISKTSIIVTENIYIIGIDKKKIDPYYISYILSLKETKDYFNSVSKGNRTKVLNINEALMLEIPEYTKEMQEKTRLYKEKLLVMGHQYRANKDEIKKSLNGQIEDSLAEATKKMQEAINSKDINKMKAIVAEMNFSISVPERILKEYEDNREE